MQGLCIHLHDIAQDYFLIILYLSVLYANEVYILVLKLISGEHVGALAMSEPNGNLLELFSLCWIFVKTVGIGLHFLGFSLAC